MKTRTKLILAFVIVSLVTLPVASFIAYSTAEKALTDEILNRLESAAEIQGHRLESIVDQNLERLALVSSRTQLRLSLENYTRDPRTEYQDTMNQILLDARSSISSFRDLSVLTLDGKIVASTDTAKIGTNHFSEEFFIRGQTEDSADIITLDENKRLELYLSGPLYLDDELLGVMMIESDVDNILSLICDYAGMGDTGETLLARRDENGNALFLTPLRFDPHAALNRTVSRENLSAPITQALLGNEGLFTDAVNYRGEPVLAATRYVEETDWGLAVEITQSEAFAPIVQLHHSLTYAILVMLAGVILVSLYIARTISKPIVDLTHAAKEVGEGDLSRRVETRSSDEIGILMRTFNEMIHRLQESYTALEEEVGERKRAEERSLLQNAVLNAINKVFQEALVCKSGEEVANKCLTVAQELTDSKFGYIGEVNKAGRFDTIAMSDPGWEACRIPKTNAVMMIKDMRIRGLWGRVLKDEKSLIVNDPASHPDSVGVPEGHPPLTSFLGVPLRHAGKTIGMIALANRESGYGPADQGAVEILSVAFVEALMRKRAEEELIRSEKLAGIGTLASGVAHELNNPLAGITGYAEAILDEENPTLVKRYAGKIVDAAERASEVVRWLSTYSRAGRDSNVADLDLNDVLSDSLEAVNLTRGSLDIEIVTDFGEIPAIRGNRSELQQVFVNLLNNSSAAMPRGGKITLSTRSKEGMVEVEVSDTGVGIPKEYISNIFDPFFTTKDVRKGTGLGLYVVSMIIRKHHGTIDVHSTKGKGTTFILRFPAREYASNLSHRADLEERVR